MHITMRCKKTLLAHAHAHAKMRIQSKQYNLIKQKFQASVCLPKAWNLNLLGAILSSV